MGGKNPQIILDDADLKQAVELSVQSAFYSTGQRCTASSRLIVTAGIHDKFVEAMTERMKSIKVGHALKSGTDIGPVVSQAQLEQDMKYIDIGQSEGARLVSGGGLVTCDTEGYYLAPTLFADSEASMRISREEIFGPVANIVRVADYDAALAMANDTEFGLSAGIATTSLKYANHFKRHSQAGMVMVNLPTAGVDYHVPFGGRKGSSYGSREQGRYAQEFTRSEDTTWFLNGAAGRPEIAPCSTAEGCDLLILISGVRDGAKIKIAAFGSSYREQANTTDSPAHKNNQWEYIYMQPTQKPTHVRYLILLMLFLVTTINYADRATIAIAGSSLQKDLGIDAVTLGYIFSAFGWAYVAGQIPGGWLLDRFGSKKVYALSIFTWSLFTVLQGFVGVRHVHGDVAMSGCRYGGPAEAPSFPGNARIVAAWFPTAERGTASAIFNSAQYFATVLFAPLMGWIVYSFGWEHVFIVMGILGIVFSLIWLKVIHSPREHPSINDAEFKHIADNGGMVDMDQRGKKSDGPKWDYIRQC